MEILYQDDRVLVCIKPSGVLSVDEPGGLPELIRQQLGDEQLVLRSVHRLDQAVSGLMVYARTARAAAELSAQIREGTFEKEYLAVVHGTPDESGRLRDLLYRDKTSRMTRVVAEPGKDVKEAVLSYSRVAAGKGLSKVRIRLHTGRTHQIRVQFSSRGFPLVGEKRYAQNDEGCPIALWSCRLAFAHPRTKEHMEFYRDPPAVYPWTEL